MKKIIVTTIIFFCVTAVSFAQDKNIKLSAGLELAFPSGTLSASQSFGIGGTAQLEIPLQKKLMGVAYGGIIFFKGKSLGSGLNNAGISIIPVRVGVKYYLTGSVYGGFQAGLGFINRGVGTAFSYSPQLGYEFKTNSGKSIDVAFKYDGNAKSGGSFSSFGVRLAYVF